MKALYTQKKECCGCAACMNICPMDAISMKPDINGFIYPTINVSLCNACGLCVGVCDFQNKSNNTNEPIATYATFNRNSLTLANSSSGGVFAALASYIFEQNGLVFGCALNENVEPEHICVDNKADMKKLQGSKYVQSNINTTYAKAQQYLDDERWVLFTGTPCQVAAFKSYLGKEYNTLITADLVCHGVPSGDFFSGYIKYLEDKLKAKVIDLKFRDKKIGWTLKGKVIYCKNGKIRERFIHPIYSYYYSYFLNGDIYRDSCYECKYASSNRQGDFTMGDYWGVEKVHPEMNCSNGVSVFLVNSKKGMLLMDKLSKFLILTISNFEQASIENAQLRQPTIKSDRRDAILKTWVNGGYKDVAKDFYYTNIIKIIVFSIKELVPYSIKISIKNLLLKK